MSTFIVCLIIILLLAFTLPHPTLETVSIWETAAQGSTTNSINSHSHLCITVVHFKTTTLHWREIGYKYLWKHHQPDHSKFPQIIRLFRIHLFFRKFYIYFYIFRLIMKITYWWIVANISVKHDGFLFFIFVFYKQNSFRLDLNEYIWPMSIVWN